MSINLQNFQVKSGSSFTTLNPFPVGYIYMSTSSTSPASIYGGTWQSLTDGKFLRPNGSWNSTGGANSHTLTEAEIPPHQHGIDVCYHTTLESEGNNAVIPYYNYSPINGELWTMNGPHKNDGTSSFSIMPPYRTCYCWYRSA